MLLITSMLYYPIRPHSDRCPHYLIRTPSTNCATSAMHPLFLALSFSVRIDPSPHHFPYNDDFFQHPLPPLLPISLAQSYQSLLYLDHTLSLSIYPQIIASPHLLVSWKPATLCS